MQSVQSVTLENNNGMLVELIDFGARVKAIKLPIDGELVDMALTYDDAQSFTEDPFYLGATCGRVSNRIANASFEIDGQTYKVDSNDGDNCLHGGNDNISLQFWELEQVSLSKTYAKYLLSSADLDGGFPGNLTLTAEYQLTEDNRLDITFNAWTDKKTPVNLTNHLYFTLGEASCMDLKLSLSSLAFLERSNQGIPTGKVLGTDVLGINLRKSTPIQQLIANSDYLREIKEKGFDTCFVLDNSPFEQAKAEVVSEKNNIKLKVFTDQPAMQFYTSEFLGAPFKSFQAVCLESQGYVDAPNHKNFPSVLLSPDSFYTNRIGYQFTAC